jgi:Phage integrase family
LRRRLRRAQSAAGLRPLRFHDLRHSFGSLVVREVDTATLKAWMGHAKLTTTERYLHAKPRHNDVARLDRAFEAGLEADLDPPRRTRGEAASVRPARDSRGSLSLVCPIDRTHFGQATEEESVH